MTTDFEEFHIQERKERTIAKVNIFERLVSHICRQMVDNHYRETYYCHDYLKAGHKKLWWYIEQNDYNLYYCQNHVYTEYKNIGGDSNG